MRVWVLRGGLVLLSGILVVALLWAFSGSGHNPNHDINMEQARPRPPSPYATPDGRQDGAGSWGITEGNRMRLLLVEDEAAIAIRIRESLEEARYTVDWARDGVEALALAEERSMPPSSWT